VPAVPAGPAPAPVPPDPSTAPIPRAAADRPIAELLGVQNTREFWVQRVVDGALQTYRVTNPSGVVLFNVGAPANEEHRARWQRVRAVRPSGVQIGGLHVGSEQRHHGPPTRREEWGLDDFAGNLRADLVLTEGGPFANASLTSAGGHPILNVQVEQKFTKKEFKVTSPDGALLLEVRDSVHSPQFALLDGTGGVAATVRQEVTAGGHSAYRIEIVGSADPVSVTVFAILIDAFKGGK
jgi:hypothetical protein